MKDFKKTLELDPKNAIARQQLTETQKLIRKVEFEKVRILKNSLLVQIIDVTVGMKAIELEEEKSAVERCREIIAEGAFVNLCSFRPSLIIYAYILLKMAAHLSLHTAALSFPNLRMENPTRLHQSSSRT